MTSMSPREIPSLVAEVHQQLIVPNFPPDEQGSADYLTRQIERGRLTITTAQLNGDWAGVAIIETFEDRTGIALLGWLAVDVRCRCSGIGHALLAQALSDVYAAGAQLVLAEIEPLTVKADRLYGDPVARTRFYASFGGVQLPIAHLQPSLGPGMAPVSLKLIALPRPGGQVTERLPTEPLRDFLETYRMPVNGDPGWAASLADLAAETVAPVPLVW